MENLNKIFIIESDLKCFNCLLFLGESDGDLQTLSLSIRGSLILILIFLSFFLNELHSLQSLFYRSAALRRTEAFDSKLLRGQPD